MGPIRPWDRPYRLRLEKGLKYLLVGSPRCAIRTCAWLNAMSPRHGDVSVGLPGADGSRNGTSKKAWTLTHLRLSSAMHGLKLKFWVGSIDNKPKMCVQLHFCESIGSSRCTFQFSIDVTKFLPVVTNRRLRIKLILS